MKILHILRSEPDQMVKGFIESLSQDVEWEESRLFTDKVDYDELVQKIFVADRGICWW